MLSLFFASKSKPNLDKRDVEVIIRSGELPALKLGQHYTILREDADAFLDRKRGELLGANGPGWQESDAIPERGPLYGKCG